MNKLKLYIEKHFTNYRHLSPYALKLLFIIKNFAEENNKNVSFNKFQIIDFNYNKELQLSFLITFNQLPTNKNEEYGFWLTESRAFVGSNMFDLNNKLYPYGYWLNFIIRDDKIKEYRDFDSCCLFSLSHPLSRKANKMLGQIYYVINKLNKRNNGN